MRTELKTCLHSVLSPQDPSLCIFDSLAPLLKHLSIPDEACARVGRQLELLRQLKARGRASFLTQSAEHAARGVEDKFVQHFFAARLARDRNLDVHREDIN